MLKTFEIFIERIIFESYDKTFRVVVVSDASTGLSFKSTFPYTPFLILPGIKYSITGHWSDEKNKYGDTFQVGFIEPANPSSRGELSVFISLFLNSTDLSQPSSPYSFLEQFNITDIHELRTLLSTRRDEVLSYFDHDPNIISNLTHALSEKRGYKDLAIFCLENGIPMDKASLIFGVLGEDGAESLKKNPYQIISIVKDVQFYFVDSLAEKLGLAPEFLPRFGGAAKYVLQKSYEQGNCCEDLNTLVNEMTQELSLRKKISSREVLVRLREMHKNNEQSHDFAIRTLEMFLDDWKQYISDQIGNDIKKPCLFYDPCIKAREDFVAQSISERINNPILLPTESLDAAFISADLSDEQKEAVKISLNSRVCVLTGGPGSGKTYTVQAIYQVLSKRESVVLCAPTGLAAKRLSQSVGASAFTIHKLLQDSFSEILSAAGTLIIDESSMLSLDLLYALLSSVSSSARLIFVGDVDQLPSIGAGLCLKDLISSGVVPVASLNQIFRQKDGSEIPQESRKILSGVSPDIAAYRPGEYLTKDLSFLSADPGELMSGVMDVFRRAQSDKGLTLNQIQVLVPIKNGPIGRDALNKAIQQNFNPKESGKDEIVFFSGKKNERIFRRGDRVIQTVNNYDKRIFNGDLGVVLHALVTDHGPRLIVRFDERDVALERDDILSLDLSYALTIHKSQGSEFEFVILPMFSSYRSMLYRNLFYTAFTRSRKYIFIIGESDAVQVACQTVRAVKRKRFLAPLLSVK